jgi:nicotinamide-nucleotide amidase
MSDPVIQTAALLSTGDEIVGGRTVDTNSSHIADRLAGLGVEVVSVMVVGDYPERIAWAWEASLERADLVLSTGGLGPTADDLTNQTLAAVAGVELERHEAEAERIRELFRLRGRPMPENNLRQADLPHGAVVVPNPLGTAPGYRLEIPRGSRRPVAIVLPGVPREMKRMLEDSVLPWVAGRLRPGQVVVARTFQTFGLPESALDELLEGAVPADQGRLAFRASFPRISVRITVTGAAGQAEQRLEQLAGEVRRRLGGAVYAEGDLGMEEVVGELLRDHGRTLATAESCTGGLIGHRLTNVAGSSDYYMGGLVAYSNDLKQEGLGVSPLTLERFGAVSEETAREMAVGACRACGADLGVATTGVAGPAGGTEAKPVGTVAIAVAERIGPEGDRSAGSGAAIDPAAWRVDSRLFHFNGTREWIKVLTSQVALDWIRRHLLGLEPPEATLDPMGRRRDGA